nr:MAG TPA: hypothetical protein [Caudoviricetes sp.]
MKQVVRYHFLSIPKKLKCEIKLTLDDRSKVISTEFEGNSYTNFRIYPLITVSIYREGITDENGTYTKAPWNPNDTLGLTKFNLPIFIQELLAIQKDMKIPELYSYQSNRLELNESIAAKARKAFMIGTNAVELSPVVLDQEETKLEGVKIKFNNEDSVVYLTLNELDSLCYNLYHLDVDSTMLMLYSQIKDGKLAPAESVKPKIDIPF